MFGGGQTLYILLAIMLSVTRAVVQRQQRPQQSADQLQYPEGYFPFEQSPARTPPKVRRPPYAQTKDHCPGTLVHNISSIIFHNDGMFLQELCVTRQRLFWSFKKKKECSITVTLTDC